MAEQQQAVRVDLTAQVEIIKRQRNEALDGAAAWEAAYWDLDRSSQQIISALREQLNAMIEEPPPQESEG